MFTADMWQSEKLTRMIRKLQPGIIINNRASIPGDFDTPEQRVGMFQNYRAWESCSTVSQSWSWTGSKVNPPREIIKLLQSTAVGDGNLLLSWGPKWDGSWDTDQTVTLEKAGNWLTRNGESIYNTHGGPWLPGKWGGTTYKNNIIYIHLINPAQDTIVLNKIKDIRILSATSLTGQSFKWQKFGNKYQLIINKGLLKDTSIVIKLKASRPVLRSDIKQPVYGSIFNDEATYGKMVHEKNDVNVDSTYVADLGKPVSVTGIYLKTSVKIPINFKVYIADAGMKWVKYTDAVIKSGKIELPVNRYQAGAYIPGTEARFIKLIILNKDQKAVNMNIKIYGRKNK